MPLQRTCSPKGMYWTGTFEGHAGYMCAHCRNIDSGYCWTSSPGDDSGMHMRLSSGGTAISEPVGFVGPYPPMTVPSSGVWTGFLGPCQ